MLHIPRSKKKSYPKCHIFHEYRCCTYTFVMYLTIYAYIVILANALSLDMSLKSTLTSSIATRRKAFMSIISTSSVVVGIPNRKVLADEVESGGEQSSLDNPIIGYDFENRDRKGNQDAVIRDDYWYVTGKLPPRLLTTQLKGDDPQWNAFGSCTTSESTGTNSCTYVSINQRRAAYTKYASSISFGALEYKKLGEILQSIQTSKATTEQQQVWEDAAMLIKPDESILPSTVDAELKMVLMATALLTSPNFPGPSRELLVARFYANEVRFAHRMLYRSIEEQNIHVANAAYEFGRDSWNSYFQTVARSIVPKVGDPLPPIV